MLFYFHFKCFMVDNNFYCFELLFTFLQLPKWFKHHLHTIFIIFQRASLSLNKLFHTLSFSFHPWKDAVLKILMKLFSRCLDCAGYDREKKTTFPYELHTNTYILIFSQIFYFFINQIFFFFLFRCQYLLTFGNQEISFNHIGRTKSEFLYLSKKIKLKKKMKVEIGISVIHNVYLIWICKRKTWEKLSTSV